MTSRLQIVGFLFATLTISGVALAQQGGGNGGGGSGGESGSRDDSILAIRRQDHERIRVPGPIKTRVAGANCLTYACNEPPQRVQPVQNSDGCGDQVRAVDRQGRVIRQICRMN